MRTILAAFVAAFAAACSSMPETADPASDAPETRAAAGSEFKEARSYQEALTLWQNAQDVNAWIGARFAYDMSRAMALSESQRSGSGQLPIHPPAEFFAAPSGVCVDLSRFAVETLLSIDPGAKPGYLMIEFTPVTIAGNTLRRHWLASFVRDGKYYFFADSKRPGHIAGPYGSTRAFIDEYAAYRGRQIVAFQELVSYQRKKRTMATKQNREVRP